MNKRVIIAAILVIIFGTGLILLFLKPVKFNKKVEALPKVTNQPKYLFGFNLDSFAVDSGLIEKNQFFSQIIENYNDTSISVHIIEDSAMKVFPLSKMRHGNKYYVFIKNDKTKSPVYFIYEVDMIKYVQIKLKEPVFVKEIQREVDTGIKTCAGIITNSLWADMTSLGASPQLINKMSDIYEWDIDFFSIQKNDKFRLIYQEVSVEGKIVGVGKILAAWFEHGGTPYYAFHFVQDGNNDYFDLEGKNLRKLFLKAPLKFSRISSGFSNSRYHPILHRYRPHHGVDYAAPKGTPVSAVGNGTIIYAAYMRGGGNTIKIRHNSAYTTAYLHLSKFAKGIRKGAKVSQGDVIGYVGCTGLCTGPHLDYRIWKNGNPVNPLTLKFPPDKSITDENRDSFENIIEKMKAELDAITFKNIKGSNLN